MANNQDSEQMETLRQSCRDAWLAGYSLDEIRGTLMNRGFPPMVVSYACEPVVDMQARFVAVSNTLQ